jgi:hypothetical protein
MQTATYKLDEVLYRLLYHRSYRDAFLRREYNLLNVEPQVLKALKTVDPRELMKMSNQICREIIYGSPEAPFGLERAYGKVLRAMEASGRDIRALVAAFLESSYFEACSALPISDHCITIEEAFHEFARSDREFLEASPENEAWLTHEFLTAVISLFAVNRRPSFSTRAYIRHNSVAYYAAPLYSHAFIAQLNSINEPSGTATSLYLYAAAGGRFIRGKISPISLSLIELGNRKIIENSRNSLFEQYSIASESLFRLTARLYKMGLLS